MRVLREEISNKNLKTSTAVSTVSARFQTIVDKNDDADVSKDVSNDFDTGVHGQALARAEEDNAENCDLS